ncbi:AMP-binding protein [Tenacibaculum sp. UWU-22]|uniref:AMP-binding protein n=1 Tax=Tenacibaculum sp. UWU-22 TaxID=3234187 RepID=UPI0034DB507B
MDTNFDINFTLNENSFSSVNELLSFARIHVSSIYPFLFQWFSADEFTVKTSGSTGKPKQIKLKKQQLLNSALATSKFFELPKKTTALLCLSPDYIAGKMMLVRALALGWHLDVVQPDLNPLKHNTKNYDFCAMAPMQVENSLDEINRIKKLIVGGGVVSKTLQNKLQKVKTKVFATYGMTETITHIAVKKLNQSKTILLFYQVLPDVKIYQDKRNCLVIAAPKVSDTLIITNDVVQLISDKQFEWLGRYDTIINSGGIKLQPEEIEEKLSTIISRRFFVSGVSDDRLGQKLILIIEGQQYKVAFNQVKNLTKYEIPKEVYFIDTFVETETKKIQRKKTLDILFKK